MDGLEQLDELFECGLQLFESIEKDYGKLEEQVKQGEQMLADITAIASKVSTEGEG